jgi:hypothetical protein
MFTVSIDDAGPYFLAVASGRAQLGHLCGFADLSARVAVAKGYRRALIDLLAVEPSLSFTEHLQLGSHVASAFEPLDRVATLVPQNEKKGTSEKAARKHGLDLRTFTSLEEANAWLLST